MVLISGLRFYRSALKKVFEKDDSPAKTMVLFISAVISEGQNEPQEMPSKSPGKSKSDALVSNYGMKSGNCSKRFPVWRKEN